MLGSARMTTIVKLRDMSKGKGHGEIDQSRPNLRMESDQALVRSQCTVYDIPFPVIPWLSPSATHYAWVKYYSLRNIRKSGKH